MLDVAQPHLFAEEAPPPPPTSGITPRAYQLAGIAAARALIAEVEGQLLAEARAAAPAPAPFARLVSLAAALIPDETIGWTVGGTRDGSGRYCAAALGDDRTADWECVAATPDAAFAGLVTLVEGKVRERIEALRAALEGA